MKDIECIDFLQWALPRMQMRWPGFRKVRRQVCRRIQRRIDCLGLVGARAYRDYLARNPDEWRVLDSLTPVTISRFYRDRDVWDFIRRRVLPAMGAGDATVRHAWSIGCASGEEPYTLKMAWQSVFADSRPAPGLRILATDIHEPVLHRARAGHYAAGSLKLLPAGWLEKAFEQRRGGFSLREQYRGGIEFRRQDIRRSLPDESFDLILCRNLVFTYFDESTQRRVLAEMLARLRPGGTLVLGRRESLPAGETPLASWHGADNLAIYLKMELNPADPAGTRMAIGGGGA